MIFRLSQKLAQKIKVTPRVCAPPDSNSFADWSAHLFTAQRAQYVRRGSYGAETAGYHSSPARAWEAGCQVSELVRRELTPGK